MQTLGFGALTLRVGVGGMLGEHGERGGIACEACKKVEENNFGLPKMDNNVLVSPYTI